MTLIGDVSAKIIITTLLSLLESALCQVWIFFYLCLSKSGYGAPWIKG